MADRPTSFAKTVEGLHHEESALDRAQALRQQFDRAQNDNQKQQESQKETRKETERPAGSPMVQTDALVLRPTPSGPMRQMSDRQANAIRLAREHDAARQAAQQRAQDFKARQGKSHDHDRER